MTAQGKQGKFYQRLNSTWFKFKFLNCGAEILVCVSWLSETPGQGSNAEFWQWHKNKTQNQEKKWILFVPFWFRVEEWQEEQIHSCGMGSGHCSGRSHSHRRVAKAGKQPRRNPGKRLVLHWNPWNCSLSEFTDPYTIEKFSVWKLTFLSLNRVKYSQ